jgi:NADH-quinone oxidoreductase subunit J
MIPFVFAVAAIVAVVFAIVTIAHSSPVINVLSLVVVFFAMAAIFALLGMDFLAAIQIIVYSGAILVLFLFVIMLLNIRSVERLGSGRRVQALLGTVVAVGIGAVALIAVSLLTPTTGAVYPGSLETGTVVPIGRALLTTHLFAFEFITLLLVAAIVGAVYLARREPR